MFWLGLVVGILAGIIIGAVGLCLIAVYCNDSDDRGN